ncbi:hypothetical protein [Leisingera methylohalidivorans]|uniref:Uncharacterized protein n=1 Tax=Leisingera methylohalidivorans DSM 14336 TaxID=999552 RepID=V9VUS7_9RHOB|nr:hypothetical protein [Leisingera methylohalidivorans]AHD01449.1 hypothetical protein METH_12860 [Leisingera methylohalidivorans DSM 14336]
MVNAPFNVMIIGQAGRLQYEALLFAASLRHCSPGFSGRLFVAVPQQGPLWQKDPGIRNQEVLQALADLGAEILPFESKAFGAAYPYGNKIEALQAMPKDEPFVFFDTDTLITGELAEVPFDFSRPSASLRVEGTWPKPTLYGPGYSGIWQSLYSRFGLDLLSSLDLSQPEEYWKRYLYFNAGFFYGACPRAFGKRFLTYAQSVRNDPPPELTGQTLEPWLDQIVLPLVIHSFGGGRDALPEGYLDGQTSCHYRLFPLLYARESDRVVELLQEIAAPNWLKKVLKGYEPIKRMVYQGRGEKVRALFDRENLPRREQAIRNRIKSEGFWMR